MNIFHRMLVQWTSKLCPFHISTNIFLGTGTLESGKIVAKPYFRGFLPLNLCGKKRLKCGLAVRISHQTIIQVCLYLLILTYIYDIFYYRQHLSLQEHGVSDWWRCLPASSGILLQHQAESCGQETSLQERCGMSKRAVSSGPCFIRLVINDKLQ